MIVLLDNFIQPPKEGNDLKLPPTNRKYNVLSNNRRISIILYGDFISISDAEVQQTVAHSQLIWAQLAIILTFCSLRSDVAQNSHASARLMQASMQLCHFVFWSGPTTYADILASNRFTCKLLLRSNYGTAWVIPGFKSYIHCLLESNRKKRRLDRHTYNDVSTIEMSEEHALYQEKNLMSRKRQVSYLMSHGMLRSKTTAKIQILD